VEVNDRPVVLFLCTHNAGRSVAGRLLLEHYAAGAVDAISAGSDPADVVNPAIVEVLRERGIDATKEVPKPITDALARVADVIVTMGCGDACPVYPAKRYVDWELPDPAGLPVVEVRPIVDEIDRRVRALLTEVVAVPP
jgi:arsenate reductase (thioredoxin)